MKFKFENKMIKIKNKNKKMNKKMGENGQRKRRGIMS